MKQTLLSLLCLLFLSNSYSQDFEINTSEKFKIKSEYLFLPEIITTETGIQFPMVAPKSGLSTKGIEIFNVTNDLSEISSTQVLLSKKHANATIKKLKDQYILVMSEGEKTYRNIKDYSLYSISETGEPIKKVTLFETGESYKEYGFPKLHTSHNEESLLVATIQNKESERLLHLNVVDSDLNESWKSTVTLPEEIIDSRFSNYALTDNGNILYVTYTSAKGEFIKDYNHYDNLKDRNVKLNMYLITEKGKVINKIDNSGVGTDSFTEINEFVKTKTGYSFTRNINKLYSTGFSRIEYIEFSNEDGSELIRKEIDIAPEFILALNENSVITSKTKVKGPKGKKQTVELRAIKNGLKNRGNVEINGNKYLSLECYSNRLEISSIGDSKKTIKESGDMIFINLEDPSDIIKHEKYHRGTVYYSRETKFFDFEGMSNISINNNLYTIYNDNLTEILEEADEDEEHLPIKSLNTSGSTASTFSEGKTSYNVLMGDNKKDFLILPKKCVKISENSIFFFAKKPSTSTLDYKVGIIKFQ